MDNFAYLKFLQNLCASDQRKVKRNALTEKKREKKTHKRSKLPDKVCAVKKLVVLGELDGKIEQEKI